MSKKLDIKVIKSIISDTNSSIKRMLQHFNIKLMYANQFIRVMNSPYKELKEDLQDVEVKANKSLIALDLSKDETLTKKQKEKKKVFIDLLNDFLDLLDEDYEIDMLDYRMKKRKVLRQFRRELKENMDKYGSVILEDSQEFLKFSRSFVQFLETSAKSLQALEKKGIF
jgi:hypothetical protein